MEGFSYFVIIIHQQMQLKHFRRFAEALLNFNSKFAIHPWKELHITMTPTTSYNEK